jgi:hypothetical protein
MHPVFHSGIVVKQSNVYKIIKKTEVQNCMKLAYTYWELCIHEWYFDSFQINLFDFKITFQEHVLIYYPSIAIWKRALGKALSSSDKHKVLASFKASQHTALPCPAPRNTQCWILTSH